jgi:hypothetical protein
MNGLNRLRFGKEPGLLAEWTSASHLLATRLSPPQPMGYEPLSAPPEEQRIT